MTASPGVRLRAGQAAGVDNMRLIVVGAGIAGTSAALAGAAAGARVTLLDGGSGASTLASGALDLTPWEDGASHDDEPLREPFVVRVLSALECFSLPARDVVLATTAGVLRPARGMDRALLDLSSLSSGVVVVPRSVHPAWDAGALARGWNDTRLARERSLEFVAVDATITRLLDERYLALADIAARHDDPARLSWLAARLKETAARAAVNRVAAIVVPPWLGVERARAEELSRQIGVPCGEALIGPGGPAGLRFEAARDRAFASAGIAVVSARATEALREGDKWKVALEHGEPLVADRVVLAMGGLVGGGVAYAPSSAILAGELPPRSRASFACTLDAPVAIGANGRAMTIPGSLFGESPEALAWPYSSAPLLERAGVLTSSSGHVKDGLYAAGDLVADRPRTWLSALAQGARAGEASCRA